MTEALIASVDVDGFRVDTPMQAGKRVLRRGLWAPFRCPCLSTSTGCGTPGFWSHRKSPMDLGTRDSTLCQDLGQGLSERSAEGRASGAFRHLRGVLCDHGALCHDDRRALLTGRRCVRTWA